jgi:hypothetical protein
VPFFLVRLEQHGAKSRRERQRHDERDDGSARNRERELAIELPGDAGNERGRHEHRREHERNGDQRSADLLHRAIRSFARVHAQRHVSLNVLDHDDRVVDDDADGQHEPEQ